MSYIGCEGKPYSSSNETKLRACGRSRKPNEDRARVQGAAVWVGAGDPGQLWRPCRTAAILGGSS